MGVDFAGKLLRDGKGMFLAYDQGFEHGPTDFDDRNVDPSYILDILHKTSCFTGLVFHEGVTRQYFDPTKETTPLIMKLNGKTAFHKDEEPYSPLLTPVARAVELGAKAVGYTIYVGSEHEAKMMSEFAVMEDAAHSLGLPVVLWAYPRGKHVDGKETSKEVLAYCARLALELDADIVKIPYTGDPESFKWVVAAAGKVKVVVQGGSKKDEGALLEEVRGFISAGAAGMAIGRNIWQAADPVSMANKIASVVYAK